MSSRAESAVIKVKSMNLLRSYQGWQSLLHVPDVPPRSRLYGLVPREVGTLWTESLTGYLNRLGWVHRTSPRGLVAQEVVPRLDQKQVPYASPFWVSGFSQVSAMSINGTGKLALEWAAVLECLTLQPDLHHLTLQWWVGDVPLRGLLRPTPAWCPRCYAEWREQGRTLYQPLLWMVRMVTLCPRHQTRLEERCPAQQCQMKPPVIPSWGRPGFCPRCATWLGYSSDGEGLQAPEPEEVAWQQWVIHALDELRGARTLSDGLRWERFFTHLAHCMEENGGYTRLSLMTGFERSLLYDWVRGTCTPSFESILEFCYGCGLTPLHVLTNQLAPLKQALQAGGTERKPRHQRSAWNRVERDRCLDFINAVLDGREKPLGIREIADRLGYDVSTLKYGFPHQCALVIKQARNARQQRTTQRVARLCNEVRQAVEAIHIQGIYPAEHRVRARLSDPNVLRMPDVRAAWHAALSAHGLQPRQRKSSASVG